MTPLARQLWQRIETIHAVTYMDARSREAAKAAGLKGFWMGYFGFRAAPLGAVGPSVVEATFYNFAPAMVARSIPDAWAFAPPASLLEPRRSSAAAALMLGSRGWTVDDWDRAAERLEARGLLEGDELSATGRAARLAIEGGTDDLAATAFAHITDDEQHRLMDDLEPLVAAVLDTGMLSFPNPMGLPRP